MSATRIANHLARSSLAFNGERLEPLLGNYALGAGHRLYSPVLQCFHSADRLSPFDEGGINGYAYCLGDPLNQLDPSGKAPVFFLSLRSLLQKSQELWRNSGGTVFRMLASQSSLRVVNQPGMMPGAISSAQSIGLPQQGILPSPILRKLTRTAPPSGLSQAPSPRLANLMSRAKGWSDPPAAPPFPHATKSRLWTSAGKIKEPEVSSIRETEAFLEMRYTSLRKPLKHAVILNATDRRLRQHRDEMFGPWWQA